MRISVVIPTWNEAGTIEGALEDLEGLGPDEVWVVDASSPDGTADLARARLGPDRVLTSPRGRGVQQNRGAAAAAGDLLVFLHADCRLAPGSLEVLRRYVSRHPKVPGGCFRMRVEDDDVRFRAIDAAADLRAGIFEIPYGDQGLFACRWAFERVGGFPELALMEDVFLALRLRSLGRLAVVPARISVSPRRWRRQGLVRQSLRNWLLTGLTALGVSPNVLARFYPMVR